MGILSGVLMTLYNKRNNLKTILESLIFPLVPSYLPSSPSLLNFSRIVEADGSVSTSHLVDGPNGCGWRDRATLCPTPAPRSPHVCAQTQGPATAWNLYVLHHPSLGVMESPVVL